MAEPRDDEFFESHEHVEALNDKITYDEFKDLSLAAARRSQSHHDDTQQLSTQAMQNAIVVADMLAKQAVRHSDLAIDRQWNKEPSEGVADALIVRALGGDPRARSALESLLEALKEE